MTLMTIFTAKLKAPPSGLLRHTGAAAPFHPSPSTGRCESDSFYGKMVGTAVLLMIRFFANPVLFSARPTL